MAYDEPTTARFRTALGEMDDLAEKRMMGGVCFMWRGNMVGGAEMTKDGMRRFMFRIGKENAAKGEALPLAQPMEMAGRKMGGFFFVDADDCDDALLRHWVNLALEFVEGLPAK